MTLTLKNAGKRAVDEVVQMYVHLHRFRIGVLHKVMGVRLPHHQHVQFQFNLSQRNLSAGCLVVNSGLSVMNATKVTIHVKLSASERKHPISASTAIASMSFCHSRDARKTLWGLLWVCWLKMAGKCAVSRVLTTLKFASKLVKISSVEQCRTMLK